MRLIHKYIFREVLSPTLIGAGAYTSVVLMNRIFQLVELAIQKSIPALTVLKLILFSMPRLLALTIPMSILLGVLVGIGRLAADSEVIAMRASGIGRLYFVRPVLLLAVPATLFCLFIMVWLEPKANYEAHQLYSLALRESDAATRIRPGAFYDTIPNTVMYAMGADAETNELKNLIFFRNLEDGSEEMTLAKRGTISFNIDKNQIEVGLFESETFTFPAGPSEEYRFVKARERHVTLPPDPSLRARLDFMSRDVPKNYSELSLGELREKYRRAANLAHPLAVQRVQGTIQAVINEKFAIPGACIVFGLFALGLGLKAQRGGKTSGFAVSIVVIIGYWGVYTMGRNFASRGLVHPIAGLWIANLIFLIAALLLLLRKEQPRERRKGSLFFWLRRREKGEVPTPTRNPRGPYTRFALLSLLDGYVLGYFLRAFLYVCLSLYVIFLLMEFRELIDLIIEHRQPLSLLWNFFLYRFPWTLHQILPMASLIGCVTALGLLSRNHEVIALQAAGVSLYRIAAPVVMAAILISGFSFLLQDHVLPVTNRRAVAFKDRIRKKEPRTYSNPATKWIFVKDRELVNYRNYRPGVREFQGISLYMIDPNTFQLESRLFAERGRYRNGRWILSNGWYRDFSSQGDSEIRLFDQRQIVDRDFPEEIFTSGVLFPFSFLPNAAKKTSEQMTFLELKEYIEQLGKGNYEVRELQVALQTKLSFPCIPLVMVLLGIPFAYRAGRRGTMVGMGISILLVLIYYAFFALLTALGNSGYLPAVLAAWGPNILFSSAALYILAQLKS
ncbi:MAG: LptF/LptG family permease [Acidobacteria bacterium]|nr:LptF/LptG family permease [Acidobacteriota bacterium]